jgi:hypothetical protein
LLRGDPLRCSSADRHLICGSNPGSPARQPYYLLEPYVFAAVWWLARPGSALNWRIGAPLLLTAGAFLAEWGRSLPASGLGMVEGVVSSLILATVIVLVAVDLWFGSAQHWCTSARPNRNENVGAGNIETGAYSKTALPLNTWGGWRTGLPQPTFQNCWTGSGP